MKKIRDEAIIVEVAVPGQRWEVENLNDSTVAVENLLVTKNCTIDLFFENVKVVEMVVPVALMSRMLIKLIG